MEILNENKDERKKRSREEGMAGNTKKKIGRRKQKQRMTERVIQREVISEARKKETTCRGHSRKVGM